jgi:hypothetical protein
VYLLFVGLAQSHNQYPRMTQPAMVHKAFVRRYKKPSFIARALPNDVVRYPLFVGSTEIMDVMSQYAQFFDSPRRNVLVHQNLEHRVLLRKRRHFLFDK